MVGTSNQSVPEMAKQHEKPRHFGAAQQDGQYPDANPWHRMELLPNKQTMDGCVNVLYIYIHMYNVMYIYIYIIYIKPNIWMQTL